MHRFRPKRYGNRPTCEFTTDKPWLDLQLDQNHRIRKPDELENQMKTPPDPINPRLLNQIQGSLIGMALGDALGAHVEFRPHDYVLEHPVTDMQGGGTWNLKKGQFTDDTSMALCLAISLITRGGFVAYDQLVRYKWWYEHGYMSSTGECFDIGAATKQSIVEFSRRQGKWRKKYRVTVTDLDRLSDDHYLQKFEVNCSTDSAAGNGALMRLAPVPLFFHKDPVAAIEYSGLSGEITHGNRRAYDACRYYGALIYAALNGFTKAQLLDVNFYQKQKHWFGDELLCDDIQAIAEGSYQRRGGYDEGIRGKGYIVHSLEAALWAFWSDEGSFKKGALAAVNLGDDTDTTAAIYGQLAGACYGYDHLPAEWVQHVYAKEFLLNLSEWIAYEGGKWQQTTSISPLHQSSKYGSRSADNLTLTHREERSRRRPIATSETHSGGKNWLYNKFMLFFGRKPPAQQPQAAEFRTPQPRRKLKPRRSSVQ